MIAFLADENFNRNIVRGTVRRLPEIDVWIAQEVGLLGVDDDVVLDWAATHGRIVLTHDASTMPEAA